MYATYSSFSRPPRDVFQGACAILEGLMKLLKWRQACRQKSASPMPGNGLALHHQSLSWIDATHLHGLCSLLSSFQNFLVVGFAFSQEIYKF